MIVLDASVVVELLTNGPMAASLRHELAARDEPFVVPHLLDIEVVSALRNLVAGQRLDSFRTAQLLAELADLPAERYPHAPLLDRIWELRHNFTAYDAVYVALAEALRTTLITVDTRLAKAAARFVDVETP